LLTYIPLTKFDAVDPSWLKVSVRIPIGLVPVVTDGRALAVVEEEGGAWLTGPAAWDADVVALVGGRALSWVEVTAGEDAEDAVVPCGVVGCVDPGTVEAEGVDVCDASMLNIGFSDHILELKGWTTKEERFFWR
jgi:hypothetical protein